MTTTIKMSFFPKGSVWLVAPALLLSAAAAPAQTSSPNIGLVTKLSGEATYWNKDDHKQPTQAQAFMKVRQGDHLKLARAGLAATALLCQRPAGDLGRPGNRNCRRSGERRRG